MKNSGLDRISSKALKDGVKVLALLLGNRVNFSKKQFLFSEQCKIGKVKPLFKRGFKSSPQKYELISLFYTVSNIIGKTTHIHTQQYLDKNRLRYKYQSGFCTNFSANSCFVELINFVLRGMDNDIHTDMVLVGLQKVFDT